MNSSSGPIPPAANDVPPHEPSPISAHAVPFQKKNGTVCAEELLAVSVAAATGIALSRVTTNSQANASYGGLAASPTNDPLGPIRSLSAGGSGSRFSARERSWGEGSFPPRRSL